jgi:hypothetical protein
LGKSSSYQIPENVDITKIREIAIEEDGEYWSTYGKWTSQSSLIEDLKQLAEGDPDLIITFYGVRDV